MVTSTGERTDAKSDPHEGSAWKLYLSGFLGGLILAIGDLATNDSSATVLKFQAVLQKYLLPNFANGGLLGLFVVGIFGGLFCWIWPTHTRGEAFVRGFSVFAILTVGTPYKVARDQIPFQKPGVAASERSELDWLPINRAAAAEGNRTLQVDGTPADAPIAVLTIDHDGVSSCKPHYWGFLGLGSLINNSVEICQTDHELKRGTKVKILGCWDTGFRSYRYVEIEYPWEGAMLRGWAMTGQAPIYWQYIVPESDSYSRLPQSCQTKTDTLPGKD